MRAWVNRLIRRDLRAISGFKCHCIDIITALVIDLQILDINIRQNIRALQKFHAR